MAGNWGDVSVHLISSSSYILVPLPGQEKEGPQLHPGMAHCSVSSNPPTPPVGWSEVTYDPRDTLACQPRALQMGLPDLERKIQHTHGDAEALTWQAPDCLGQRPGHWALSPRDYLQAPAVPFPGRVAQQTPDPNGTGMAAKYRHRGTSWPATKGRKGGPASPRTVGSRPGSPGAGSIGSCRSPAPGHSAGCRQARVRVQVTRSAGPGQEL